MPQHEMHMVPLPPMFQAIYPPPPPEEALHLLLKEPEPKRQRLDDSLLIPEDQFLAQYQGPTHINVSVPNIDRANLRGQVLEITVESLSETISTLKEKIAGEIQLPSNKQKLSGKLGFLKDNLSLAYYNVAGGGTLSLSLRERGGRKRKN
ncbi:putative splicing factor 3A subunit 1 [Heracleum sosnowskyi]|uniref:Splicing factor 3A subunit 1 n=1 Tax=Heracleum sosnowskyi TaxID=360622 RepID=A0AAD8MVH3_9APIA|nr:putative splicing factor 3A subunit 1 [Heracleum sosnowskyi]